VLREPALPTLASGMTLGRPRRCPTTWTGREASRCPHFRGSAGTCLGRYLATQRALVGPVVKKWIQTRRPPVARQFTRDTLLGLLGASGLWVLGGGTEPRPNPTVNHCWCCCPVNLLGSRIQSKASISPLLRRQRAFDIPTTLLLSRRHAALRPFPPRGRRRYRRADPNGRRRPCSCEEQSAGG
jgi:hypothetical protein